MAQISRPFQIGLVAVVLLAGVWLFALQGHGSSSTSGSNAPVPAPQQSAASASTYHGAAPGVAGLTGAVAKARGAVSASEQNAKALAEKSAQASSATAGATSGAAAVHVTHANGSVTAKAVTTSAPKAASAPAATVQRHAVVVVHSPPKTAHVLSLARQHAVEAQLKSGNVVVVLFWDHKGTDDVAVQRAVRAVAHGQRHLAVYQALAGEVASFGSVTKGVQVLGTPTTLVIGKQGHTIVITGLTDTYSLSQAITEARSS